MGLTASWMMPEGGDEAKVDLHCAGSGCGVHVALSVVWSCVRQHDSTT
jgi:hypothetical protein